MSTHGVRPAQVAAMVIFAFSCFGLLLFVWLSFGGTIPLKPQGYRFQVAFSEAITLAEQADVRIAGVSVGKVVAKEGDAKGNRTLATIELERAYAPLRSGARATLRQKTLLGETYVEIAPGIAQAAEIPEGGRLENSRVQPSVELDEVLTVFPEQTRNAFRRWQANAAETIEGRGQDLNASLGNLSGFAESGSDVLEVLARRRKALRSLVSETGVVFGALTRDEDQLRAFLADSSQWLQATAAEREALADSIQAFPTFLRESRATLTRLERFSQDTKPLIDDLGPVARDLGPTLADLRRATPGLRATFDNLPVLTAASRRGLPDLSRVLRGLEPVLGSTAAMLSQMNPILQWLQYAQPQVSDIITVPGAALAGKRARLNEAGAGHALPQIVTTGSESILSLTRDPENRGNSYLRPDAYRFDAYKQGYNILPVWDCVNAGGERKAEPSSPGCIVQAPFDFRGLSQRFPHVTESAG